MATTDCPLCSSDGGVLVFRAPRFRVIWADQESDFPAFYRVVWTKHVAEFSDLSLADQHLCMSAVTQVERVLRQQLQPAKINLASLGNVVPHLHWHVIARFDWDNRYPQPVWGTAQRARDHGKLQKLLAQRASVERALVQALNSLTPLET